MSFQIREGTIKDALPSLPNIVPEAPTALHCEPEEMIIFKMSFSSIGICLKIALRSWKKSKWINCNYSVGYRMLGQRSFDCLIMRLPADSHRLETFLTRCIERAVWMDPLTAQTACNQSVRTLDVGGTKDHLIVL